MCVTLERTFHFNRFTPPGIIQTIFSRVRPVPPSAPPSFTANSYRAGARGQGQGQGGQGQGGQGEALSDVCWDSAFLQAHPSVKVLVQLVGAGDGAGSGGGGGSGGGDWSSLAFSSQLRIRGVGHTLHAHLIVQKLDEYTTATQEILSQYPGLGHVRLSSTCPECLMNQGNSYAMDSPLFELPVYLGLGLLSGVISVVFQNLRRFFSSLYLPPGPLGGVPPPLRPLLAGLACGLAALALPQTLFNSYATLDQLLGFQATTLPPGLLLELLTSKLLLSSFCLASGLVGGIFAPSLFFGATAGAAYHALVASLLPLALSDTPAYAAVGAAATLGAVFRAPLTASMLMFEVTQNHDIVLPVLAAAGLAGLFAEILSNPRKRW
ncbi:chloride channel [Ochromonadaceae sp. CCMP2298]|nr:chloride channel [Ochromonadaceae sp. CCMP2298]